MSDGTKTCCGGACMTKSSNALLTWDTPEVSAKVFGAIVGTLLLIKFVNILSLFFYLGVLVLGVSAAGEYAGKLTTGQGFVTRFKPAYKSAAGDFAEKYAPHVVTTFKKVELKAQEIVYAKDIESTAKAAGVSYILYKLTSWLSLWTLLFVSTVAAFTVPPVYLKNQKQIDEAVITYSKLAKDKLAELLELLKEKSGPALDAAEKKLGPVGSFIKSKIPVRTAGSTVGESPLTPAETTSADEKVTNPLSSESSHDVIGETLDKASSKASATAEEYNL